MSVDKLKVPFAGLVYGQIVYWGVMLGSLIVIFASIIAGYAESVGAEIDAGGKVMGVLAALYVKEDKTHD